MTGVAPSTHRRTMLALLSILLSIVPFTTIAFINIPFGFQKRRGPTDILYERRTQGDVSPTFSTPTSASSSDGARDDVLGGLSKFHLSILNRNNNRQRFVTGRFPLTVTVVECPTRRWLGLGQTNRATTEILVNGTTLQRSLASFDRFYWLEDHERLELTENSSMVSLEFLAEIHMDHPGYVQILSSQGAGSTATSRRLLNQQGSRTSWTQPWRQPLQIANPKKTELSDTDHLWVTGFSFTGRRGILNSLACPGTDSCDIESINTRTASTLQWPNEVSAIPEHLFTNASSTLPNFPAQQKQSYQDALLVSDGFLVPGKDRGGLYVIKNPGDPLTESSVRLTKSSSSDDDRWFYHRAVWVDLTGDGRKSILTARCQVSTRVLANNKNGGADSTTGIKKTGQLVFLECPKPDSFHPQTGIPLEKDGTEFDPFSERNLPWKTHILDEGPDVMFCVADFDTTDDTLEVVSSQFFGNKVSLHSIQKGSQPCVVFKRIIDDQCGAAFGSILADLDCCHKDSALSRCVVNSGSTVAPSEGELFSHLLVTSHECSYADKETAKNPHRVDRVEAPLDSSVTDGGSLFAYRIPEGKDAWKTESWIRTTVATGFKVRGQLSNMINPGAPGFVYTFHVKRNDESRRPMIAVAGDCAESAYIFRPEGGEFNMDSDASGMRDPSTRYKLMVEIECGATVGSIGVGYDKFSSEEPETDYAKLYIPCYEKDKVLVFGLGSGEDDY